MAQFKTVSLAVAVALIGAGSVAFSLTAPSVSHAHGSATGIVKERMDAMKAMRDALKALRPMMDAEQVDKEAALPHAQEIVRHSGEIVKLFPNEPIMPPSEALPEIWEEWEDFQEAARNTESRAADLVTAIQAGPGEGALRAYARLAKSCKDCHGDFKAD